MPISPLLPTDRSALAGGIRYFTPGQVSLSRELGCGGRFSVLARCDFGRGASLGNVNLELDKEIYRAQPTNCSPPSMV